MHHTSECNIDEGVTKTGFAANETPVANVKSWSFQNGSLSVTNSYKRRQQEENEERDQEHELAISRYRDRQLSLEQENDELLAEAEKYSKLYHELLNEAKDLKEQAVDKDNELAETQVEVSLLRKKQRLHEEAEEHHCSELAAKVVHFMTRF